MPSHVKLPQAQETITLARASHGFRARSKWLVSAVCPASWNKQNRKMDNLPTGALYAINTDGKPCSDLESSVVGEQDLEDPQYDHRIEGHVP